MDARVAAIIDTVLPCPRESARGQGALRLAGEHILAIRVVALLGGGRRGLVSMTPLVGHDFDRCPADAAARARYDRPAAGEPVRWCCNQTPISLNRTISGVDLDRLHEVDRMTGTGLNQAFEGRFGVEVVPLDVVADVADRKDPDAQLRELRLDLL